MALRTIGTSIDTARCTGCGACVRVCSTGALALIGGKAVVTGKHSLGCDQCAAVCPVGAITVAFPDNDAHTLVTVPTHERWLPYGGGDAAALVQLMRSRRSCRNFDDTPVPEAVLDDLVRIGTMAPSGHNTQTWLFTILPSRAALQELGLRVAAFFERLNHLAESRLARFVARLFYGDALGAYYREHYESVREGLRRWREEGRDPLFHGARAAIIISSRPDINNAGRDTLMAAQNILLAAHAMGYATCMIGFATNAMEHDKSIQQAIGIARDEVVHAVIAVGKSSVVYQRPARRRRVVPRVFAP